MPVYFFALGISPNLNGSRLLWSFLIIHFLIYPASNGYNSYFDKDEKSIGGLKNPPPVHKGLYYTSLALDLFALMLAFFKINPWFACLLLVYGLASKAYSHPSIRLKKFPVGGLLTVAFFQGFFTFAMSYIGINNFTPENLWNDRVIIPAILSSLFLLGTYPMTQIYQHEEDFARGDQTVSLKFGVRGTFIFVLVVFSIITLGYLGYFYQYQCYSFYTSIFYCPIARCYFFSDLVCARLVQSCQSKLQ
ncbi:MAG: UbiA family prenyltransferase [Cytophagales bacterium]|nr:UbiA family prenyltransferase [Cytophagales bacterium]